MDIPQALKQYLVAPFRLIFRPSRCDLWAQVLLLSFAILALVGLGSGCTGATQRIQVASEMRSYRLYVPENLPEDASVPLLLALHQFADTARGMEWMSGLSELAEAEGFIVAYPQGKRRMWDTTPDGDLADVHFLDALLDELIANYPVNPQRIYATGASAGAMMVQFYACRRDRLAAIAPVMGPLQSETLSGCTGSLPVLYMHGVEDPVIAYAGGLTAAGPGNDVEFYAAEATAEAWAVRNDCASPPEVETLRNEAGERIALRYRYACAPNRETLLYAIQNHGHTWPGGRNRFPRFIVGDVNDDFNASQAIWAFFMRHQRNGES